MCRRSTCQVRFTRMTPWHKDECGRRHVWCLAQCEKDRYTDRWVEKSKLWVGRKSDVRLHDTWICFFTCVSNKRRLMMMRRLMMIHGTQNTDAHRQMSSSYSQSIPSPVTSVYLLTPPHASPPSSSFKANLQVTHEDYEVCFSFFSPHFPRFKEPKTQWNLLSVVSLQMYSLKYNNSRGIRQLAYSFNVVI